MKIISWNINGLKSWSDDNNVFDFLEKENPDILYLQEIKTSQIKINSENEINKNFSPNLEKILKLFPYQYFYFADKKGYSGTAILSKIKPKKVDFGLKNKEKENFDKEGRVIIAEFENLSVVNVYTPNSKIDFSRLKYRINTWDENFLNLLKELKEKKEVLVCGDMNVLACDIDLQNYNFYFKNSEFKNKIFEERKSFKRFLDSGFEDIYRKFYPEKIAFTWAGPQALQLPKTRLDYFLGTKEIVKNSMKTNIFQEKGSDHFPISLEINDNIFLDNELKIKNEKEKIIFPEIKEENNDEYFQETLF